MTQQQMVDAIVSYIQTDANLIKVLRIVIANNLPTADPTRLAAIITALSIPLVD